MMTKEESTKIVHFMTPWAEILMLGHDHTSHYSHDRICIIFYSINIQQIDYNLNIMLLSCAIVDFYLFYDWAIDMHI